MPLPLCFGNWLGPGWVVQECGCRADAAVAGVGLLLSTPPSSPFETGKRKIFKTFAAESRNRLLLPVWTDSLN